MRNYSSKEIKEYINKNNLETIRINNMKPSVSLALMVKNEERTIKRTLESINDFCTEFIIGIDRASSDNTQNIIKRFMKKRNKKGEVFYFTFKNNFSAIRNRIIEKCTSNYIMILDGHEYFEDGDAKVLPQIFDKILSNVKFIYLNLFNRETGTVISQLRIFRNNINAFYKGKVHNMLVCPGADMIKDSTLVDGIMLIHDRAKEDVADRAVLREDMIMTNMKADLEKEPNNIKALFYLSRQCLLSKKYDESIKYGKRYIELMQNGYNKSVAMANLGICYVNKNDIETARQCFRDAIIIEPSYPYSYIVLATTYLKERKYKEAEDLVHSAMRNAKKPLTFIPVPIAFYTWYPYFLLASIRYEQVRFKEAAEIIKNVEKYRNLLMDEEHKLVDTLINAINKKSSTNFKGVILNDIYISDWSALSARQNSMVSNASVRV